MITIKTEKDIEILRESGRRLARILRLVSEKVAPGVTASELNDLALKLTLEGGDKAAFFNYRPVGAKRAYPAALCVSINEEVVHGIPNEANKVLKNGDIVSLDMGLIHDGLITDMAITVPVGEVTPELKKLMNVTKEALNVAIKAAKASNHIGDIGYSIERLVRPHGYGIVEDLCGHGVGYKVHEDPFVPNFGEKGKGEKLKPGMVIAIEPMLNLGTHKVKVAKDDWTYVTADASPSAHFEHTILITKAGSEILTRE
ncbi:MAG: type I methionyl aminopeptidase [Minisyncoccia bacterium]